MADNVLSNFKPEQYGHVSFRVPERVGVNELETIYRETVIARFEVFETYIIAKVTTTETHRLRPCSEVDFRPKIVDKVRASFRSGSMAN
ncbi:unnamed protein product [Dovyalis caffra]|uniref:Uncharacterized protein n=1 Tax=Dovyalis caffra TaxID=77055 RepID=A0AAV1QSP4_9ROSI|nr:unnamed protein product [Dovyalis caffra]